jgi:hypothetical protein
MPSRLAATYAAATVLVAVGGPVLVDCIRARPPVGRRPVGGPRDRRHAVAALAVSLPAAEHAASASLAACTTRVATALMRLLDHHP